MIALLEDNDRRREEMLTTLRDSLPDAKIFTKPSAFEFLDWLRENIGTVDLICLDHDLEPPLDDPKRDMGDGREVVRWLILQPKKVPVLIHTTNSRCGSEMETALKDAGWQVYWTPPYNDLEWVRRSWIKRVNEMLDRSKQP